MPWTGKLNAADSPLHVGAWYVGHSNSTPEITNGAHSGGCAEAQAC